MAKSLIINFLVTTVTITINHSALQIYISWSDLHSGNYIYTSTSHTIIAMKQLCIPVAVAAMILVCSNPVLSLREGAPAEACGDLMPQHGFEEAQLTTSNYKILLHNFEQVMINGSTILFYLPGRTYKSEN